MFGNEAEIALGAWEGSPARVRSRLERRRPSLGGCPGTALVRSVTPTGFQGQVGVLQHLTGDVNPLL